MLACVYAYACTHMGGRMCFGANQGVVGVGGWRCKMMADLNPEPPPGTPLHFKTEGGIIYGVEV